MRNWVKRLAPAAAFAALAIVVGLVGCSGPAAPAHDVHWASFGGDPSENHYSPLTQISDRSIGRLRLAWSYDIDTLPASTTTPLEIDGVLYFGAGFSVVHALDARTGRLLWEFDPHAAEAAGHRLRSSWGIRGIAYWQGKIYTGTVDGRLIAIDAKTGRQIWSVMTLSPDDGRYISGPPWVFNGKVVIGHGGADFAPVRGYVTAYDANTGAELWRWYTVPGNPANGFENDAMRAAAPTWHGQWWRFGGGGTVWNAMAYDARYDRLYIGTGNGAPWNQKIRSPGGGDNLYLCSIIALDADTGRYVWHYQVNPGESWDYNAAMDIELADLTIGGQVRHVLMHAPKNGFFYVIDRENGHLITARQFAHTANWASRIDETTGRPVENPAARFPNGQAFTLFPSPVGAHSVEAMAFNRDTGLVYIPSIEQGRVYIDAPDLAHWRFAPGQVINNAIGKAPPNIVVPHGSNELLAWDPVAQRAAWSLPLPGLKAGGVLTTAGNLVFQGDVSGTFNAYAANSGRKLWSFDAQTGILADPISYQLDGRQYVSVITSWRLSGSSGPGLDWDYHTQHRRVLTFALDGAAHLPAADRTPAPIVTDPSFHLDEAKATAGAATFALHCALCHGPALAAGGAAPDLRRSNIPTSLGDLASVLHDGALVTNGMPRFEDLSRRDIENIQHYIRQQARAVAMPPPAPPPPARRS